MQYSFHGFDIKEKIASGGMSTVYKGVHQTLGYPVAIKILHPGLAGDSNFIKRFEREAKAASALRSNNIASVIDFGSEDDVYFIVMEFINGRDLAQLFKEIQKSTDQAGAFPIEMALLLIEEVAYGLKEAHEHGLIHRDIKPANILVDHRGEVKIADFGLARDTSDIGHPDSLDLTTPGTVLGTPSYMSPEQAAGKADLDNRTDIFSLGVMAYQLLTGQKPFKGDSPTAVQEMIINTNPNPLTMDNCPLLTAEIDTMIGKMLAKDPQKRYSTMDKLLRGLKECMESIDSSGNLNRYRRDYLSNFAKDPIEFSKELRGKSVSGHLKLGYHHKNQGFSNIDDAIREFTYVLSIDPDNTKASEALRELRNRQLEHGKMEDVSDEDVTQVMTSISPDSTDSMDSAEPVEPPVEPEPSGIEEPIPEMDSTTVIPASTPPVEPAVDKASDSKRPWFIGAGVIVVVLLVVVFSMSQRDKPTDPVDGQQVVAEATPIPDQLPTTDEQAGEAGEADEVIAESDSQGVQIVELNPALVPEQPEVETGSQADVVTTPVVAEPGQGRIKVISRPVGAQVQFRKGGQRSYETVGTTPYTSDLLAEGRWDIRVTLEGYQAAGVQGSVEPDKTLNYNFPMKKIVAAVKADGYVRLVISPFGDVYVDGEHRITEARLAILPLSAEEPHEIKIKHQATFSNLVLDNIRVSAGDTIRLPRQVHRWGSLVVSSNTECEILIDDTWKGPQKRWQLERIGTGEHIISVKRAGLVVDVATLLVGNERRELSPIDPNQSPLRYLIDVKLDSDVKLHFRMKQES